MSEQSTEAAEPEVLAAEESAPEIEPTNETFDSDYVRKLRRSEAKYRTEAKTNAEAARKLAEIEDANKSEQQRLMERAETAEKSRADLELKLMRVEVAVAKGLPSDLTARLKGTTKEELEADADELLTYVKPAPGKASDALVGARTPPAQSEDVEQVAARIFASG